MARYAKNTQVDASRSIGEIEKTITRYGADQFVYGRDDKASRAFIGFRIDLVSVKINFAIPDKSQYNKTEKGRDRNENQIFMEWQKAYRQRWRAVALVVKAKLEAVDSGISTIEQEFLAFILLPNDQTVLDWIAPQLEKIETKRMPALLPDFSKGA